ncbi:MAG: SDR family oxidoreductase [Actinobacteria bacterium]|nr:MAG: SDR family oxidoreductase [Actinomycetota bacterium]
MASADFTIVTGGCGAIGVAVVRAFVREGHRVGVLDRRPLPRELDALGEAVRYADCDVADEDEVARALEKVTSGVAIRHLVGVAGGALDEEVRAQQAGTLPDVATVDATLRENVRTQYVALHAALPSLLRLDGHRSLTLVSSINAIAGFGLPGYSAAKAALIGLTNALTGPLGRLGIRVNVVAPGTVPTNRTLSLWHDADETFAALLDYSALGRLGTPEDIAEAVVVLATMLTHVTGQVLVVDGGQSVYRPLGD